MNEQKPPIRLNVPFDKEAPKKLRAGERVLLSGEIYTARDAAHKRITESLRQGGRPPFPLQDACIYYTGPCPAAPGEIIGPCGPTTSGRMDAYTPQLLARGLTGMIGKGKRSQAVKHEIKQRGAVYFAITGGVALLVAQHVLKCELVAFKDLGPEAVYKLTVNELPVIVAVDAAGKDVYER